MSFDPHDLALGVLEEFAGAHATVDQLWFDFPACTDTPAVKPQGPGAAAGAHGRRKGGEAGAGHPAHVQGTGGGKVSQARIDALKEALGHIEDITGSALSEPGAGSNPLLEQLNIIAEQALNADERSRLCESNGHDRTQMQSRIIELSRERDAATAQLKAYSDADGVYCWNCAAPCHHGAQARDTIAVLREIARYGTADPEERWRGEDARYLQGLAVKAIAALGEPKTD